MEYIGRMGYVFMGSDESLAGLSPYVVVGAERARV
jgi:hypothetical protein